MPPRPLCEVVYWYVACSLNEGMKMSSEDGETPLLADPYGTYARTPFAPPTVLWKSRGGPRSAVGPRLGYCRSPIVQYMLLAFYVVAQRLITHHDICFHPKNHSQSMNWLGQCSSCRPCHQGAALDFDISSNQTLHGALIVQSNLAARSMACRFSVLRI
jgi:hypothetical protein